MQQAVSISRKPEIQAAIEEHTSKHFDKLDISAEHILAALGKLGFAKVTDPRQLSSKVRALELLGRYL